MTWMLSGHPIVQRRLELICNLPSSFCCSPATLEEAREQVANPEAYAAALALADVNPSGSGETTFHTAIHADAEDLPSTVNNSGGQSGPWNSEDFASGEPKTDITEVLSHSPTSTLQAWPPFPPCSALQHEHGTQECESLCYNLSSMQVLFALVHRVGD